MKKSVMLLAVLELVGALACATQKHVPVAAKASEGSGAAGVECQATQSIDIIEPERGVLEFRPNAVCWSVQPASNVPFTKLTAAHVCLNISKKSATNESEPFVLQPLTNLRPQTEIGFAQGYYYVTACIPKDDDCSKQCPDPGGPETIKGELQVVTQSQDLK